MPQTSRVADVGVGICCCHIDPPCIEMSGVIVTGAGTITVEGGKVSRITSIVLAGCGHTGIMVTGSATEISEGLGTARVADQFVGCFTGSLVTGAGTDFTGG